MKIVDKVDNIKGKLNRCCDIILAMLKKQNSLSFLIITIVFVSFFTPLSPLSAAFTFTRDLRLGDQGEDVLYLQQILNSDAATQITKTGPGSLGQETEWFGSLTKVAVAKYQEKNAASILFPAGLTSGTGIFGPATRAFLNKSLSDVANTINTLNNNAVVALPFNSTSVKGVAASTAGSSRSAESSGASSASSASAGLSALAGSTPPPFGGLTGTAIPCTCVMSTSFGYSLIPITPPLAGLPKFVMYNPLTAKTYAFGKIMTPGTYVLGTHTGSDVVCKMQVGYYCIPVGLGKDVVMVGTSGGSTGGTTPPGETEPETPTSTPPTQPATTTPPTNGQCSGDLATDWSFSSGIKNQIGDASPALISMLTCMCGKYKEQGVDKPVITSIGDSNHTGSLKTCNVASTYPGQCSSSGSSCCWHSQGSCHYGGKANDNKSHAVDLGMSNSSVTRAVASACGSGFVLNEGNHMHAQASDCTPNH